MAKSAPVKYEVRWRQSGTAQWGPISSIDPTDEIVVEGLDRTKSYDFEVRAVSSCGARSAWVSSAQSISDVGPNNIVLADVKTQADNAAADALAANQELANIASDNVLSQGEKPTVIRDVNVITAEQTGIDTQANAFGITTEKAAYDNAVSALSTYLATLTTPTLWSDLSGDTTIVGTTFRSKFADVYTTRQALLNAIYGAAKAKADTAQGAANLAGSSAAVLNPKFLIDLSGWTFDTAGSGEWYREALIHPPDSTIGTYLVHAGQAGQLTTTARNIGGGVAVTPGQSISASIAMRELGANAGSRAYVRIGWYNAAGGQITNSTQGVNICSPDSGYFTQGVSRVFGTAPAGAVRAVLEIQFDNHTSGYYTATNGYISGQPATLDEVGNSPSYVKTPVMGGSAIVVPNANFLAPIDGAGNIPGWKSENGATLAYYTTSASPFTSVQCLHATLNGSSPSGFGARGPSFKADAGDVFYLKAWVFSDTGALAEVIVLFASSSGSYLGQITAQATGYGAWQQVSASGAAPAGTAQAVILALNSNWAGGSSYFYGISVTRAHSLDNEVVDGSNYARIKGSELSSGLHKLGVAGSGARLGDLRNQIMVGVGNYGAGWSGGSISYSVTSTSATISVGAATLQVDQTSIAYNASSTTVSGSAGTSVTYYLYYDDDGYTGGSKTLNATTSRITSLSARGRLLVGHVTVSFPRGGTGTGGGGMSCPDENAWVLRADSDGIRPDWCVRAKEIEVGHYLRLTDGRVGLVTYSERMAADRVRVFDENGATLTCSRSAPLELAGAAGGCVPAPEATGRKIKALVECVQFDPIIWKVEDAGPGYVQHITCQNACFWTGDDPDYLFGHHNLKP